MTEPRPNRPRSRRLRRGHSASAPGPSGAAGPLASPAPRGPERARPRKIEPQLFAQVDKYIGAFVQHRFGPVLGSVAEGFFGGATKAEREDQALRTAFMLFFVYGWRDPQGVRVLDLFARVGPPLEPAQRSLLAMLLQTELRLFRLEDRIEANRQLGGRELLRDEPMRLVDPHAWKTLEPGDALLAWSMPNGDVWRPIGVANQLVAARVEACLAGLDALAARSGCPRAELGLRQPAQLFWLVYRAANLGPDASAPG